MKLRLLSLLTALLVLNLPLSAQQPPAEVQVAMNAINGEHMRAHVKFLASDLLEGRGTGQRGGELAVVYIATQFELLGLKPGGLEGSYFQAVPLTGTELKPSSTFVFASPQGEHVLTYLDDYVATAASLRPVQDVDAEVIFVGYGVEAPEYNWDDYKGVDVRGKVLLMLVNDPPSDDPKHFGGKALTYYGRWTYKYEKALEKGAAGAILIHTTPMAGYAWPVVRNSWSGEQHYVRLKPGEPALAVSGWITEAVARSLLKTTGEDLEALLVAAARRDFRPVPLPIRLRAHLESKVRDMETANVLGLVEGTDLKDEVVIYTAHYDHLGVGTPVDGDAIYNGAVDNATGCALLLELARVFAAMPRKPRRSILFIGIAAEEAGLRGSAYYATHPVLPAGKTAFNLNYDAFLMLGRTKDVTLRGIERTSVYPLAQRILRGMNLTLKPDAHPEQGYYYRSDQFSLAKAGVPAIAVVQGLDYVGKPEGWGEAQYENYRTKHYHQPSDAYDPAWDLSGLVQMAQLGLWLSWEVANLPELPRWNPGDEFAAIRETSLKQN